MCPHSPSLINEAIKMINEDLKSLSAWATQNCLLINPTKSQTIILGYHKLLAKVDHSNLDSVTLNNSTIPFQRHVKNLGLHMTEDLSWNDHVKHICQKTYASLHSLNRLKNFLPTKLKTMLIKSLIMPHFDYCDVVYNDLTEDLSIRLQRAQNSCVRFILGIKKSDHITPAFANLEWLRLKDRRNLHSVCFVHRLLSFPVPSYLAKNFKFLHSNHDFGTRSRSGTQLTFPTHRTSLLDNSFTINAIRTWNALPVEIRDTHHQNYQLFKNETYKYYLHNHKI